MLSASIWRVYSVLLSRPTPGSLVHIGKRKAVEREAELLAAAPGPLRPGSAWKSIHSRSWPGSSVSSRSALLLDCQPGGRLAAIRQGNGLPSRIQAAGRRWPVGASSIRKLPLRIAISAAPRADLTTTGTVGR